jgi:DNA replicative helicase MCM subunit Mcm2 (Cdc46/Mcm family)
LEAAVKAARSLNRIRMSDMTRLAWEEVYPKLSEGSSSLTGSITARAEAQVVRFATVYALLDGSRFIEPEHLKAAMSLWEYAEASAQYIFGQSTGDTIADRIRKTLLEHGPTTRTGINGLFSGNVPRDRIEHALGRLVDDGLIDREVQETRGRPVEIWSACE